MREIKYYSGFLKYLSALFIAAFFVFMLPAPVMAAPVLRLSVSSGPVGTPVTISGSVFDSYEGDSIHILFDTTEIDSSPVVIPSSGTFTIYTTIPPNASAGQHLIGAKRETTDSTFLINAPFTVDPRVITLDILEGVAGTSVELTAGGFYPGDAVNFKYENPTATDIGSISASSSGKASRAYVIPAGVAGNHKFTATNIRGNTAEVLFRVLPGLKLNTDSAPVKSSLNVRGTGFGPRSGVSITLGTVSIASVVTNDYGSFESEFAVPDITPTTYYLKAQDALGNKVEKEFTVSASASVSTGTGSVGTPVTVNGDGFAPGNTVTVYYDDKPVANATADQSGGFTITFKVPTSSGGNHTISVSDGVNKRDYPYTVESTPPGAPVLSIPGNNTITGAYTYFQWLPVSDTSVPVVYDLEIASDSNFSKVVLKKSSLPDAQYTLAEKEKLTADSIDSLFFWRVMAIDGAGNRSIWSEARAFYVDIPKAPVIALPPDNAVVAFPLRLGWQPVNSLSEPITYTVQVSRNVEFNELLFDQKGVKNPDFVISDQFKDYFKKKIPHYWRVKAVDNAGNASSWSATGSFNIASSGFPTWATITLIVIGAIAAVLLAFRLGRRTAYH